jgi:hypothetical protein
MGYAPTSAEEERIAKVIVEAAYAVHSQLGPGLLESIYEACFCYELGKRGLLTGGKLLYRLFMMVSNLMKDCAWMFWYKTGLSVS